MTGSHFSSRIILNLIRFSNTMMPVSRRFLVAVISVAAIAAIVTSLISMNITAVAGPTFASGKMTAIRSGEWTEAMQNPVMKAQYVPISQTLVDVDPKLKVALEGADRRYEILANAKGYSTSVDQAEEVELTEEEANNLISILPPGHETQRVQDETISKYDRVFVELDGKYYILTISTVGTQ